MVLQMLNASGRREKRKGIELHIIKWLKLYSINANSKILFTLIAPSYKITAN